MYAVFGLKKRVPIGIAHAYIMQNGEVIQVQPYKSPKGWAMRAEKGHKNLKGKLFNIELNYATKDSPTKAQYTALAGEYKKLQEQFKEDDIVILPHKEVDRGIPGAHSDPTNFSFSELTKALKEQGVDTSKVKMESQGRYDVSNQREQKWHWPPSLSGKIEKGPDEK